ncbi:N-acetylmuramoyl-L-alanine amidase [Companilactobacillus sp.]|jgi:N-acetylmuramoyl-L-alanine amidase|uniref:N-acetylmuramoyl-L-alanine amidase n=1 Tax=Companilactobacillus sp. TaxID=2767905 RepID=UPI0025B7B422|nr:N-acetylmuramoyl-L-alanine amidase [Companilactobacillus sp.]MCH4008206.1 N-acetylmuramoyl-L-alanine amidase [Companilactobacillus sp.]MCH4051615.1 N-acetylmuramoyl-L-alanine amidase [Companilactobacillus sp.]MCH4076149.1 N-acetylmuramoyl-L-alanine amidase [Companilactobacillus sp.]MCH4124724.1 N-acetylmuramoyl-L-alanine amidase [Companilactobacillus sp.]MCH4131266.1 N-acetylmuramoyl-L-alanine amidase [Companilactobacillus sp.]
MKKILVKVLAFLRKYKVFVALIFLLAISSASTVVLANANSVTVKSDSVNVRIGPGLSYANMGQVKKGDKLSIISEKNKWYEVRLAGDKIGWVASWLLDNTTVSSTTNKVGIIKVQNTTVFKNASATSAVLGTVSQSQKVSIMYQENDWTQILYKGTAGWVKSDFIQGTQQTSGEDKTSNDSTKSNSNDVKTVTVTQPSTKFRIEPNSSGRVIKSVNVGKTFDYLGKNGKWYKVRDKDGSVGYVASWVVTVSGTKDPIKSAATNISEATIVIDPGHGGSDTGALSKKKTYEKNFTLEYAQAIKSQLEKTGARVILTRSNDSTKSLGDRARLSSKIEADAFISLHFDSSSSENAGSGITTYYYQSNKDSKLATDVNNQLKGIKIDNRGTQQKDLYVLHYNSQPSILLELGYINSKSDYKHINSETYKQQVARAVTAGLKNYFQ